MGSGVIVGRTGRYKIFPVLGTAIMCVGFVLLSRMDSSTPTLMQSLYLFVLGTGIGMCMQVLVLIVQNTTDFADLGVATSGVTFFRTIGSSFGAAVFGSLFTNFLGRRIGPALADSGAPPAAARSPQVLHHLPHRVAEPIVHAYAQSLDLVFLCAAPVAAVGFIVAIMLREVPLRDARATAATDLGEGFAMLASESSDKLLEMAIVASFAPGRRLSGCARCAPGWAASSTSPRCGRACRSTGTPRCSDQPGSPTSPNDYGSPTKCSSRRLIASSAPAMHFTPATPCGSPRRGAARSTSSPTSWRAGSPTSSPNRPHSTAGRTASRSPTRWNGSRIGYWCNGIGTKIASSCPRAAPTDDCWRRDEVWPK